MRVRKRPTDEEEEAICSVQRLQLSLSGFVDKVYIICWAQMGEIRIKEIVVMEIHHHIVKSNV